MTYILTYPPLPYRAAGGSGRPRPPTYTRVVGYRRYPTGTTDVRPASATTTSRSACGAGRVPPSPQRKGHLAGDERTRGRCRRATNTPRACHTGRWRCPSGDCTTRPTIRSLDGSSHSHLYIWDTNTSTANRGRHHYES